MTDRQPDDLYDALRDRLADYGQEPPAPLWANIRAHLPPPVAAPQLRRRRRAAWLGTLLVLLSAGMLGWWWQAGRGPFRPGAGLGSQAVEVPSASQPTKAGAGDGNPVMPLRPAAAGTAVASSEAVEEAGNSALTQPTAVEVAKAMPLPANLPAIPLGPTAAGAEASADARRAGARPAGTEQLLAAGRAGRRRETYLAKTRAASEPALGTARIAITPSRTLAIGTKHTALTPSGTVIARGLQSDSGALLAQTAADAGVGQVASPVPAVARPAATRTASPRATPSATARAATSVAHASRVAFNAPVLADGAPQSAKILAEAAGENMPGAATSTQVAWPPIELRTAALAQAPALAPAPLVRADTLAPPSVPAVRRWAVQALAGPALTSSLLGMTQRTAAAAPVNNTFPTSSPTQVAQNTGLPENEQAASGFGSEVQVQRQLTGRWSLSTGLGYHAFATNQTINVRVAHASATSSNFRPDSFSTRSVRDTYHFLTLPVRVGYQLGAGPARLRYGLRAGADVAFYLGGRSTEGSSTGTISRGWGVSGSPYRPFSLALSLGAEVRYQLAPGLELLAQPTLTHFVTSVARPASGYVARYPLAATALMGVAYWLR